MSQSYESSSGSGFNASQSSHCCIWPSFHLVAVLVFMKCVAPAVCISGAAMVSLASSHPAGPVHGS